jgi:putative transposase
MSPSDLSDRQWTYLAPLLAPGPSEAPCGGRPREYALRRIAEAILQVVKTGCQRRQLPPDLPPWKSVCEAFRGWRKQGVWARISQALREQGQR